MSPEQLRDLRDVPDWYISGISPLTSLGCPTRGYIPGMTHDRSQGSIAEETSQGPIEWSINP
ncbi:hypothetical protein CROQUDRAFT_661827 [Cronartium quercuum f. sp. fusiforme G11]|uniref:Uncharacterized protein n=1 Tax=Cronartium quercuum f. sp. fusiforme G11 TaxID=708437 RepID=A0A9P6NBC4_9BASI|nr:hypothetical protein CROQUDRAFT_661827 [Cronartium quercuum f. sp. fusiforme G11]